jgi:hypothetical protein
MKMLTLKLSAYLPVLAYVRFGPKAEHRPTPFWIGQSGRLRWLTEPAESAGA